jgi:hypothetical protein
VLGGALAAGTLAALPAEAAAHSSSASRIAFDVDTDNLSDEGTYGDSGANGLSEGDNANGLANGLDEGDNANGLANGLDEGDNANGLANGLEANGL